MEQLDFGPPRDRRQSRRIMTLRNGAIAGLSVIVLFMTFSLIEEARGRSLTTNGRLSSIRNDGEPVVVVHEAPPPVAPSDVVVRDDRAADPLLTSAAARSEYLGVREGAPDAAVETSSVQASAVKPAPLLRDGKPSGRVRIVQGPDGLHVEVVKP